MITRSADVDLSAILEYEQGELGPEKTMELFASLIKSGLAWRLQGHYGRTAQEFIERGYISDKGDITDKGRGPISLIYHRDWE